VLQAACDLLWEKSLKTKVNLKSLVSVTPSNVNTFPYRLLNGMFCIPTDGFLIVDLLQAPQLFCHLRKPTCWQRPRGSTFQSVPCVPLRLSTCVLTQDFIFFAH
jgi:hypothetical protein